MSIVQSRRRLLTTALSAVAGWGGFDRLGGSNPLAAEPPPEVTTVRMEQVSPVVCIAPEYVADELLRVEGFTDIRHELGDGPPVQMIVRDKLDWTLEFVPAVLPEIEAGARVIMVAGVHVGCFELFADDNIRSITDLKGRTVGVPAPNEAPRHLVSIMATMSR